MRTRCDRVGKEFGYLPLGVSRFVWAFGVEWWGGYKLDERVNASKVLV